MKNIVILIFTLFYLKGYSQDQAIEIYLREKPSKSYLIKIDDKVLIKCRNYVTGNKKLVVARLSLIDSNKFYFYPVDKQFRESIYTLSTLNEIGVKTNYHRMLFFVNLGLKINCILNGHYVDLKDENNLNFKMVNVKTRKWDVRLVEQ